VGLDVKHLKYRKRKGRLLALYLEIGFLTLDALNLANLNQRSQNAGHLGSANAYGIRKHLALKQEVRTLGHYREGLFRNLGGFFLGSKFLCGGLALTVLRTLGTLYGAVKHSGQALDNGGLFLVRNLIQTLRIIQSGDVGQILDSNGQCDGVGDLGHSDCLSGF
jgi:hypothetical protein